jgi:hypothetical protein
VKGQEAQMENLNYPEEDHPWLMRFTTLSIFGGILFCIPGCVTIMGDRPGESAIGILALLPPVMLIFACIHILKSTDGFRHWDYGVSTINKIIGWLIIFYGCCMGISLIFLAPFMGFLDSLGISIISGLGFRK